MRILHYITAQEANDLISIHLRTLTKAMEDIAEVRVATAKDTFHQILDDMKPDIVHVHACWNYKAADIVKQTARKGFAVVVSPHWGLEPYTMRHEHRITKMLKGYIYQRQMIQQAEALLVTTETERRHLLDLGWKKRVNVVKSTILNRLYSASRQAEETLLFYKKVIDTRYFRLMTDKEKEAVCSLLCLGKSRENSRTLLNSNQILHLHELNPEQWKRILLYADDEDIRDLIDKGAHIMQLDVPDINTSSIDRYDNPHPKVMGKLDTSAFREKAVRLTTKEEKEICAVSAMLLAAKEHQKRHTLSMRHMAEIYEAIKYKDFDEDQFARIVRQLGIRKFTERLLQVISEDFYMGEGFMPLKPRNDRGTQRIRETIIH